MMKHLFSRLSLHYGYAESNLDSDTESIYECSCLRESPPPFKASLSLGYDSNSTLTPEHYCTNPVGDYCSDNDTTLSSLTFKCQDSDCLNRKFCGDDNEVKRLSIYTLEDVSSHDSYDDCWIILYDKVYDVANFILEHPGGEDVILEHAGRDATVAFRSVGHTPQTLVSLERYLIGILPEDQRIFKEDGDCQWSIS